MYEPLYQEWGYKIIQSSYGELKGQKRYYRVFYKVTTLLEEASNNFFFTIHLKSIFVSTISGIYFFFLTLSKIFSSMLCSFRMLFKSSSLIG